MIANIRTYNGGRYGRGGEYVADITPEYFKNGNMKKTGFTVNKVIKWNKKEYAYGGANHSESIYRVLEG